MKEEAYSLNFHFEDQHWWFMGRRKIVLDRISKTFSFGMAAKSVLDFGCGTGKMLQCLGEFGTVIGVDSSETGLNFCRQRGIQNAYKDEVFFQTNTRAFDLILLLDVLEHIPDEGAILAKLSQLLNDSGTVLFTVPAYQFLWGDEDILSNHVRRYTRSSLKRVLESAGFEVSYSSYFNFFLLPLIAGILVPKRIFLKNRRPVSNLSPVNPIINSILMGVLYFESLLLRWIKFPMGASILVCAKKRSHD